MSTPLRHLLVCLVFLVFPFSYASGGTEPELPAVSGYEGVQRIDILAGSYFFKPDHIMVKVNIPVELSVRKEWGSSPTPSRYMSRGLGLTSRSH